MFILLSSSLSSLFSSSSLSSFSFSFSSSSSQSKPTSLSSPSSTPTSLSTSSSSKLSSTKSLSSSTTESSSKLLSSNKSLSSSSTALSPSLSSSITSSLLTALRSSLRLRSSSSSSLIINKLIKYLIIIIITFNNLNVYALNQFNNLNKLQNQSFINENHKAKQHYQQLKTLGSCTAPEVMVNGSPSPDIAGTVSGGEFGTIEEIQFVGMVMTPSSNNNDNNDNNDNNEESTNIRQKRICKIKCLNGVWIGPFCAFQTADEYKPILRSCRVPIIANGTIIIIDSKNSKNYHHHDKKMMKKSSSKYLNRKNLLPHGSIIKIKCKEIGMFKLETINGNDTIQCNDGVWDPTIIPHCVPTTLHMNFSLSSPPSILYTLLDGTLGINDIDDDDDDDNDVVDEESDEIDEDYNTNIFKNHQHQHYQPQIVITPGSILHLDCVFQETFGQPQWSVIDIPIYDNDNNDNEIESSTSSSYDQQHYHQIHHTIIMNKKHYNNQQENFSEQSSKNQRQRQQQYSMSRNKHLLRRNKYRRKYYHYQQQQQQKQQQKQPGSSTNSIRKHTTGWTILSTDKHSWKYRLAIYYASEIDTGRYICTTPNGQTNFIDIVVKDVQCPTLEELKQQQQHYYYRNDINRLASITGYHMNDRIRFTCIDGYRLSEENYHEVKCLPNGHWSHPFPICQEISCPDYVNIKNLDPNLFITYERLTSSNDDVDNSSFDDNDNNDRKKQALRFRCPIGYRLIGKSLIKCDYRKNVWMNTFPKCQQLQCPEPELPDDNDDENLIIIKSNSLSNQTKKSYNIGDYIKFGCRRKGYRIINGNDIITCLHNEQWSSTTPKCEQVCLYPAKLLHGYYEPIKFYYNIGDLVNVHCDNGYHLVNEFHHHHHIVQTNNNTTMLCSQNGLWIGPAIKCKRRSSNNNNNRIDQKSTPTPTL